MTDITANVIVSMPSQLFTMARSFKAVANGKIYIGKIDTDPLNPENQIQVYVENEDGSHVPVSQPIIINAAGYPVYNGQIAKFVTVQGHSMAVYDAYGAQQFYFPNVLKYDPDQLAQRLVEPNGTSYIHHSGENVSNASLDKYLSWMNGDISAFGGVYNAPLSASLNKTALEEMESLFGGVNLNLMGKSVYLPDDMNISVSFLNIWGGGDIYPGNGYNFYLKTNGYFYGEDFIVHGSEISSIRPRLVGVVDGSITKIKSIKASKFYTTGRVEIFTAIGPLNINPDEVSYGCDSISLTHFHAESPYDFILLTRDFPHETIDISNFTVHNMAGTFIQIGSVNENIYEKQIRHAMKNVSIHDYSIDNDDDFWADGSNGYTAMALVSCWSLSHYKGYQKGVKCRSNATLEMYDIYNKAHLVQESDITIEDCIGWNSCLMVPHKIKEAYQYSSTNKRWFYRRNYVSVMQELFPDITLANSKGTFLFAETRDWVGSPTVGPLVYGNRFVHIHNCDIELITLNYVANGTPLTNVVISGCHFSSPANTSTNFVRVSLYPYNLRQQITVTDNIFDLPDALVVGLVQMNTGSQSGGGGFTGTLNISNNKGMFGDLTVFTDYTTNNDGYSNMNLVISDNKFNSKTRCRITNPSSNPTLSDMCTCTGNVLSGTELDFGHLWNSVGIMRVGFDGISSSPVVLFRVGVPTTTNIATGDRYIIINNGDSGDRNLKFTISKSSTATTIAFTNSTGEKVTKTTGVNNGTFAMNIGSATSFEVNCVVSSTGIEIQAEASVTQRYVFSGYTV